MIVSYNQALFLKSLSDFEKETLKTKIETNVFAFTNDISELYSGVLGELSGRIKVLDVITSAMNLTIAYSEVPFNDNYFINLGKIYQKNYEYLLNVFKYSNKADLEKLSLDFSKILENTTKELIFEFFLCKNEGLRAIKIDNLAFYHLVALLYINVETIYYETISDEALKMKKYFNYRLVNSNYKNKIKETKISYNFNYENKNAKLNYIGMNAQVLDDDIEDYYINLRVFYDHFDYYPNLDKLINYINENVPLNSNIFITLPLFLETESVVLKSKYHGYRTVYYDLFNFYNRAIKKVVTLAKNYRLKVLIPNCMSYGDYVWWYLLVHNIAKSSAVKNIEVGFVLDDTDLLYDFEEIETADVVLIDLDELAYFANFENGLTFDLFKSELEENLREIHAVLKYKKIKHPIKTLKIKSEKIYEKLIMMGFTDFIYPTQNLPSVSNALANYMSRRGKYVGLSKQKRIKKA